MKEKLKISQNTDNQLFIFFKFVFLLYILGLAACSNQKSSDKIAAKPLAKVGETTLYSTDLSGLLPKGSSKADSVEIVSRYINNWVRKQLLLNKAQKEVKIDEAEIQRKLQDYRYDLIAYAFEKDYVEKNLNQKVNEQEITKYYQENQANFELKQNIIKGYLVKMPSDLAEKDSLKRYMQTPPNTHNLTKLKEFCVRYAQSYQLYDTLWIDFERVIKNTPFEQIANKIDFLQQNTFAETNDGRSLYYLRIIEFKISNQISPLPFVRERIINMIINQRKVNLAKTLEKNIYEEAKKNQSFVIYK